MTRTTGLKCCGQRAVPVKIMTISCRRKFLCSDASTRDSGVKGLGISVHFLHHLGSEDVLNDGMPDLLALELAYGGGGKAKKAWTHLKRMRE